MRWTRLLETASWIVVTPAVLLALSHSNAGELGLGAFGPPAWTTLSRWLIAGGIIAAGSAALARNRRVAGLAAAAAIGLLDVRWQHRGIRTRDVVFKGNGISIAATIYEPTRGGAHPAAVLVHGSAPVKRGFYSMWVERLARDGMTVIVPDKRGVGGTGGEFERQNNASKANLELLTTDVVAALDYAQRLTGIDTSRLGLFGLSQAGWVAPMAAVRTTKARFLLMITAPTVSVREEGVWSRLRGDEERAPTTQLDVAEHVMDTLSIGGVDARTALGALTIPGLWLFGADDNSIPTRKSVAVLDSLGHLGHRFEWVTFPAAGHLIMSRRGRVLPRVVPASWTTIEQWIKRLP